jgi:hypothetical protein
MIIILLHFSLAEVWLVVEYFEKYKRLVYLVNKVKIAGDNVTACL